MLKSFQGEIDSLTSRSKNAETAFLNCYGQVTQMSGAAVDVADEVVNIVVAVAADVDVASAVDVDVAAAVNVDDVAVATKKSDKKLWPVIFILSFALLTPHHQHFQPLFPTPPLHQRHLHLLYPHLHPPSHQTHHMPWNTAPPCTRTTSSC